MGNYLPFQNTRVSERKSIMEIQFMLEQAGFGKTAITKTDGQYAVFAAYKQAEFQFAVDPEAIQRAIISNSSDRRQRDIHMSTPRGKAALLEIHEQSLRVGWRLMSLHVKALTDSVKLGVITVAQAFAGNLVTVSKGGQRLTLADHLTTSIEDGTFNSEGLLNKFLIEAPKGGRG